MDDLFIFNLPISNLNKMHITSLQFWQSHYYNFDASELMKQILKENCIPMIVDLLLQFSFVIMSKRVTKNNLRDNAELAVKRQHVKVEYDADVNSTGKNNDNICDFSGTTYCD